MAKLIRDLIPTDMRAHGYEPQLRVVSGTEKLKWLLEKLVEEAIEARDSDGSHAELGDVYGVLEAIAREQRCVVRDYAVEAWRKERRRGAFHEGHLWLDSDSTEGLNRRYAEDEYRKAEEARNA